MWLARMVSSFPFFPILEDTVQPADVFAILGETVSSFHVIQQNQLQHVVNAELIITHQQNRPRPCRESTQLCHHRIHDGEAWA